MREELVGWKARRASPTRQSFCPPLSMQPSTIKQQTVRVFLSVYTILTLCYKIPASKGGLDWAGQADTHPWHPYFFRCNVDSRSFVSTDVAPKSLSTNYNIEFYLSLRCTVISQDNAVTTALRMRAVCYSFIRSSSYFLYHFFLLPPRCSHSPLPSAVFFFQCLLITCPFYLFCYVFPVVNPFNKIPRVHL